MRIAFQKVCDNAQLISVVEKLHCTTPTDPRLAERAEFAVRRLDEIWSASEYGFSQTIDERPVSRTASCLALTTTMSKSALESDENRNTQDRACMTCPNVGHTVKVRNVPLREHYHNDRHRTDRPCKLKKRPAVHWQNRMVV